MRVTADAAGPLPLAQSRDRQRSRRALGRGAVRLVLPVALYLQLVLGYSPLKVGLAFLPANLIMGALSIGVSALLVMRFGLKRPLVAGLALAARGSCCSPACRSTEASSPTSCRP